MLKPEQLSIFLLAAGSGERMGKQEKLSVKIGGTSLLEHCLSTLQALHSPISVAIPKDSAEFPKIQKSLSQNEPANSHIHWLTGGSSRQQSVKILLDNCHREFIFLHEVARPHIALGTCQKLLHSFDPAQDDALTLCSPFAKRDTLIQVENGYVRNAIASNGLMQQQTPQIFRRSALIDAYHNNTELFSSTTLLMLKAGYHVKYLSHQGNNLKITYPEDLC